MALIGLSGYAQSGKDSTGAVLVEEHGFKRLAFADALKDVLYDLNPLTSAVPHKGIIAADIQHWVDAKGWEWTKANTEARAYLQRLGVAARDHIDPLAWVNAVIRQVNDDGNYVVTDVRFPNEFEAIHEMGGEVWRVVRLDHQPPNQHISEVALDGYDFDRDLTLRNYHDDLDALYQAISVEVNEALSQEG